MKILLGGDFHLDSAMETGLSAQSARERRNELLLTFSRFVDTAAEHDAATVLLAGDLFDTARATLRTRRFVGDVIASHPEIRFLMVTGNHDADLVPLFSGAEAENLTVFPGDRFESVWLDEHTVVSGTSAPGGGELLGSLPTFSSPDGEPVFHIVLLHGQVVRSGRGTPGDIPLRALRDRGIDILALGHEHTYRAEKLDRRGIFVYAGCPEGRGFDECGVKGCALLDTDPSAERVTFLPLSRRILHEVLVDVSGCAGTDEARRCVEAAIGNISSGDMVKVVLTGEVAPEADIDPLHLAQWLEGRFYFSRVSDATRLCIRPEEYIHDVSLKGGFIRAIMASKLPQEDKERAILYGLRALRGEEIE